eukprot:COSAG02_NODE_4140_length_5724_cov_12.520889_4_plen_88_part_00
MATTLAATTAAATAGSTVHGVAYLINIYFFYNSCVFKLQRELTVRMTGDEISPSKDFLQKQNGRFLARECPLYSKESASNSTKADER